MGVVRPEIEKYSFNPRLKMLSFILMGGGLLLFILGVVFNMDYPTRIWVSLLHNSFFFVAIGLSAMFYVASQTVGYNGWFILVKRVFEAMGTSVLVGAPILGLVLILGYYNIYEWSHEGVMTPGDPHYDNLIHQKDFFLNPTIFFAFSAIYLIGWAVLTFFLRKNSEAQDKLSTSNLTGIVANYNKSKVISMAFLVLFGVSSSTAMWHWFMSIDPHWFSTLYGWYCFISMFVASMAVCTLVVIYLRSQGYLRNISEEHVHDLGKWVFAFSVAWTYLWFSQFMLIWYSNIPEETMYFNDRFDNYSFLFFANFIINFLVPFFCLMTAGNKRRLDVLIFVCCMVIFGHWLDYYLMATPGAIKNAHYIVDGHQVFNFGIGALEIGLAVFFAGLFMFCTFWRLSKVSLVPHNHPFVKESVVHHV